MEKSINDMTVEEIEKVLAAKKAVEAKHELIRKIDELQSFLYSNFFKNDRQLFDDVSEHLIAAQFEAVRSR